MSLICSVCDGECSLFDVVDFNKSCEDSRGQALGLSGIPIYYIQCQNCGFCYAPEMTEWKASVFKNKIYNDQYPLVDPEYLDIRPKQNFAKLSAFFGDFSDSFSHLDYGGGNGLMTKLLCDSGWRSTSYDPFNEKNIDVDQLGRYDLITAFEVFEHVADIKALMLDLQRLLSANGVILFSTALSDGNIPDDQRLTWWYASPRNGHISLFSKKSLLSLSKRNRFNLASNWIELHAFYTKPPFWANRVFGF